jgi:hypothetical protein
MSRFLGILAVLVVVLLAMGFAAGNAGHLVTLNLGILILYRVPVTLVAFGGLLAGMLVMFSTGIYTDLKVRRILRERLAEESRKEQVWIDRNQQDLFDRAEEREAHPAMDAPGAETLSSPEPPMPAAFAEPPRQTEEEELPASTAGPLEETEEAKNMHRGGPEDGGAAASRDPEERRTE